MKWLKNIIKGKNKIKWTKNNVLRELIDIKEFLIIKRKINRFTYKINIKFYM